MGAAKAEIDSKNQGFGFIHTTGSVLFPCLSCLSGPGPTETLTLAENECIMMDFDCLLFIWKDYTNEPHLHSDIQEMK